MIRPFPSRCLYFRLQEFMSNIRVWPPLQEKGERHQNLILFISEFDKRTAPSPSLPPSPEDSSVLGKNESKLQNL